MRKRSLLLVAAVMALHAASVGAECLRFEPAEVELRGVLSSRVFPGPPNYESIAAGDRAERAFIVTLADPICVAADPASELNRVAQSKIFEVHVRAPGIDLGTLVGKSVSVRGRLSTGITGHDRTTVVMDVVSARAG